MAKWEDTVIKDVKVNINTPDWMQVISKGELIISVLPLLEAQAELSFKAGIKEAADLLDKWRIQGTHLISLEALEALRSGDYD